MIDRNEIRSHIFSLQDEKYREFHSSLVPGENTIIGVRVPVMRQYARELIRTWGDDIDGLIDEIGTDYYEEIMLRGMIIGLSGKKEPEWYYKHIDRFVPEIRNWAICDVFCTGLKFTKKHLNDVYEYLQRYLSSCDEYAVRFGVVMLLDYYINEEYLDKVFMHADSIRHEGYYVKMAVAWLISICFVKFYDKTKIYMEVCNLDDFTYNKALQKARESLRITPEQKEELNSMKRKG
ncbi:MAG: DNA alkylation repair protein [Bacillota bacterium]|nr:DNA alkylation repair protein [Bacillota bacterium]